MWWNLEMQSIGSINRKQFLGMYRIVIACLYCCNLSKEGDVIFLQFLSSLCPPYTSWKMWVYFLMWASMFEIAFTPSFWHSRLKHFWNFLLSILILLAFIYLFLFLCGLPFGLAFMLQDMSMFKIQLLHNFS